KSVACRSASWVETIPICDPSAPTRRTCAERMRSFMRGSAETPHHLLPMRRHRPFAGADRTRGTQPAEYRCRSGRLSTLGADPGRARSDGSDVGRLLALRAVDDVELDRLALREGLVALAVDRREVDEHIVLPLARDEPETLLVAEPLHGALLCQRALLCPERAERSTARARRPTRRTGSTDPCRGRLTSRVRGGDRSRPGGEACRPRSC